MPVTDLTDYLGMPQQAPEDPLFYQKQREAAYAQEAVDFNKRVAARGELNRLQRQAPVLQAQQAQIAYDKVAQDARDLRMKQEIEAQVERAANELAGGNLNPESEDFGAKYRDLATRNPLAFSDPRFSKVAGLYDAQNQNYQAARKQQMDAERAAAAKANEDLRTAIGGFLEYGGDANLVPSIKSVQQAKYLEGQMRKAAREAVGTRGGAKDIAGQMMQKDYELVSSEIDRIEKAGKEVIYDKDGTEIPNPTYEKLLGEKDRLFNDLRGSYRGIYSPAQTPTVQPTTQQQVSVNPAGTRFSPESLLPQDSIPALVVNKSLPFASTIKAPTNTVEEYKSLPTKTENNFVNFAGKEDVTPEFRQQVIKDLKDFVSKPVPQAEKGQSIEEVESRDERLADSIKKAEEAAAIADENNLYRDAWTKSKAKIDEALLKMADESGYTPEQIANSIKKGGVGKVRFNIDGKTLTPKEWLESLLGAKFYQSASPFKQWSDTTILGEMTGKLAAEPWARVFEAYMQEKSKPVATAAPQVNVAPAVMEPGQVMTAPGGGTITRNK